MKWNVREITCDFWQVLYKACMQFTKHHLLCQDNCLIWFQLEEQTKQSIIKAQSPPIYNSKTPLHSKTCIHKQTDRKATSGDVMSSHVMNSLTLRGFNVGLSLARDNRPDKPAQF